MTPIELFWRKTERVGNCIVWTGALGGRGYGKIGSSRNGVKRFHIASRWIYQQCFGELPSKKTLVMHSCDTPACVALQHLTIGTHKQNSADAANKGRTLRGDRHNMARLTKSDVVAIRIAYVGGEQQQSIAARFGIGQAQVSRIVTRQQWRYLRMLPKWIVDVLDKQLPDLTGGERDRIAEAIYEAAVSNPAIVEAIINAIANSARTVLEQRCIRDAAGEMSREIGRNCAQTVVFALGEA